MNYDQYLNSRISAVPPSGIRRFFDLAASRKEAISLGVGEPDFKTPYPFRDAAIPVNHAGYIPQQIQPTDTPLVIRMREATKLREVKVLTKEEMNEIQRLP